jgi:hypothetical protein
MQGKTKAVTIFFEMPMQSPFSKRGNALLQPTAALSTVEPLSHVQEPFEYVAPRAMMSGSCRSKKYSRYIMFQKIIICQSTCFIFIKCIANKFET